MSTIYALATARGKAGVAIIRVSGPRAIEGLLPVVGSFGPMRAAVLRYIKDSDEVLDQALVIRFSPEASFTGEDVVELHLHGSLAIVEAVLDRVSSVAGFRLAEPGEFTRRALENGRLDIAQVEGLADLIDAETEAQRRQAMRVFAGALGEKVQAWRRDLMRAAALLEAVLDFADEDVPVDVRPEVVGLVGKLLSELRVEQAGYQAAERIRDGYEVAILGAPNAGKSTLLNRLAGRTAALTSQYAGTTRDIIEVRMNLGGLAVTMLDTAGLRSSVDPVESMGIALALERAAAADLRIHLLGGDGVEPLLDLQPDDIVVQGKSDQHATSGFAISGLTGQGVDELVARITQVLQRRSAAAGTITRLRHRIAVEKAIAGLGIAADMLADPNLSEEIVAEILRSVTSDLGELIGQVGVEDLLGEIFSSFCIGK